MPCPQWQPMQINTTVSVKVALQNFRCKCVMTSNTINYTKFQLPERHWHQIFYESVSTFTDNASLPSEYAAKLSNMVMQQLEHQDIPFTETTLHPELYSLIKMHKSQHHTYHTNGLLSMMDTLWIVHYRNSQKWIQQSWYGIYMNRVVTEHKTLHLDDIFHVTREIFISVTA
jgi:hypothetical protein